ncbi:MAG TPA: nitronate monooxygenase [Geminicoccaceae bacterium]|nr:nitronate monooxygenase [Geminicoccaceae bacterium]
MWPRRDLIDLLGIDHPIIQAPMGGESTPMLAVAVCNAGGLGGLGCSFMSLEELRASADELRSGTKGPFNLNFFAHPEPSEDPDVNAQTRARVAPFYAELGLANLPDRGEAPCDTFNEAKLSVLLEIRPTVTSFHFGLPPRDMVKALQDVGSVILCTATTVAEARMLNDAGVDAIIAQGWEAGGHRGTFETSFEDFGVGTMALIPQVVDAVDVPVIAAGGIADGRGIAAALALGASGVQMGTAFLSCPEANISDTYRAALRHARDDDTRLTRAFSGRSARAKNNRYMESMAEHRTSLPDFPTMYGFSEPLEQASAQRGDTGFQFLLYGQAAALNCELPAADLMARLIHDAQSVLAVISGSAVHPG